MKTSILAGIHDNRLGIVIARIITLGENITAMSVDGIDNRLAFTIPFTRRKITILFEIHGVAHGRVVTFNEKHLMVNFFINFPDVL